MHRAENLRLFPGCIRHEFISASELIRDVLLWIPTHGRAKAGRPARTYIQQLCEDTGCCPEDLPRAMNDREEWRERVRDIRATSTIWWWWLDTTLVHITFWYIYSKCLTSRLLSVYYQPRLCASNPDWSNERKGFILKKNNKQTIPDRNYYWLRLRRWYSASGKYTNPC